MHLTPKQALGILLRLAVVCLITGLGLGHEWSTFYRVHVYEHMVIGIFYWIIVIVFFVSIIADLDRFATHRKKIMFLPSFVGLLLLLSGVVVNRIQYSRTHAKNAFVAEYLGDPDEENNVVFHLELKRDGNYVLYHTAYSGIVMFFYYGEYDLKGNHLKLRASNKLPGISNQMIITDETSNEIIKTLVQTNRNWQPIKGRKEFKFRRT